jgi:O-antigen ligase/tetratricopeptide (TPR) repeat protein
MLAVCLLAPLLVGGGPAWVQLGLSAAALLAALAWVVSRKGESAPVPFAGVAALALGVTLLQLIPLPAALVGLLSPHALELRSEAGGSLGRFIPLTLDVPGTVLAAVRGFACLAILMVVASTIHSRRRGVTFAKALVFLGGGIALLSIGQRLFGVDKIYGLYTVRDLPGSGFFGSFVNGNHAASLFALAAILALGCARETDGPMRPALGVAGILSAAALLSTSSRTGVLSAVLGALLLFAIWLVRRFGAARGPWAAAGLLLVGAPAALLLALGLRGPRQGWSLIAPLSEQKVRGWRDALSMIGDYPWTGVGRGAFEAPASIYRATTESVRLVFPENILVQMVSEWGIPVALGLMAIFLVTAVEVARRLGRWEPTYQAAACGVLAVIGHELADFGLELPGVAFPTALALGLVAGRLQSSRGTPSDDKQTAPWAGWRLSAPVLGGWLALLFAGAWAAPRTLEAEGERMSALARARAPIARAELAAAITRHPADYYLELLAAELEEADGGKTALRSLNRAQRLLPRSPIPHLHTARTLARMGHPSQAAVEYRLAAEWGSAVHHDELVRAVGFQHLASAIPRQPTALMKLGHFLATHRRIEEADAVTRLGVELDKGGEPLRVRRAQIAILSRDQGFVQKAARELAEVAENPRSLELAAEALARTGDRAGAREILLRAVRDHPSDGALMIRSARILFRQGDLAEARQLLGTPSIASYPIAERIQAEELIADIAAKEGLSVLAQAARARARMLGRLIENHPR